jgi:anaerobic dimethyl sulfoxide reductase subunit B (iron-sulfur subunit)
MSEQYGFSYDPNRCIQCRTCEVACKSTHDIAPGIKWRRVLETWDGAYPAVTRAFLSLACLHCESPACMAACAAGAIVKRPEDGIVVVDRDRCNGCRDCFTACPYGVPQFGEDGIMQKCDFCLGTGGSPVCALSCPSGALGFGVLDELLAAPAGRTAVRMEGATGPSLVIVGNAALDAPLVKVENIVKQNLPE